jgi:hypothetical protein
LSKNRSSEIQFVADKVYIHHWPPETPKWSQSRKDNITKEINENKGKNKITIKDKLVQIDGYVFTSVRKIGLTIPQFKRQSTMIFEGHCEEFDAHVHITTRSKNYLEIFNKLMIWRDIYFPDTPFLDSKN